MTELRTRLRAILQIADDTSGRGAGISLHDALHRAKYADVRRAFGPDDLLPLIRADRALVDQWLSYSQDKRTSSGWHVSSEGELGQVDIPGHTVQFDSVEEAIATYIVRELDYWSGVARSG